MPGAERIDARRADQGGISHLSEPLFAAVLPLYDRLGIQRIELTAGLARGGALWPAFGAVPRDDHAWHRLGKEIRSRFGREPDQVQAEVRERIEGHLSAGPHAILEIVNEASGSDSAPPRLGQRLLAGTRYEAVIELGNPETRKIVENRIGKIYSPK